MPTSVDISQIGNKPPVLRAMPPPIMVSDLEPEVIQPGSKWDAQDETAEHADNNKEEIPYQNSSISGKEMGFQVIYPLNLEPG